MLGPYHKIYKIKIIIIWVNKESKTDFIKVLFKVGNSIETCSQWVHMTNLMRTQQFMIMELFLPNKKTLKKANLPNPQLHLQYMMKFQN